MHNRISAYSIRSRNRRKFDPDGKFIHAPWLMSPMERQLAGVELGRNYPEPLVQHGDAQAHAGTLCSGKEQSGNVDHCKLNRLT
jgi:hypothetical protein